MTPKLLTIKEAAVIARRDPQTVWLWCKKKTDGLPHRQERPRGPIHIWEHDLYAYLGLTEGVLTGDRTGAHAPA